MYNILSDFDNDFLILKINKLNKSSILCQGKKTLLILKKKVIMLQPEIMTQEQ